MVARIGIGIECIIPSSDPARTEEIVNGQRSTVNCQCDGERVRVGGAGNYHQQSTICKYPSTIANGQYTYSTIHVGAPDRTPRPPLVCPLGLDELVRVAYNGRFSSPMGEWRYEHTIFNFILTERLAPEMFLAERVRQIEDLADLR